MNCADLRSWLAGVSRGMSQAYGTCNAWLGLSIASALLVFQPMMFATCAYAIGLALPFGRRFDRVDFERGLYLFNPFLFGCFAFAAFGPGIRSIGAISVAVPAIVLVALRFDAIGWRTYFTVPYIAAAYASVIVLDRRLPAFPVAGLPHEDLLSGVVTSFAQVLLSADPRVGFVVLLVGLVVATLPTIAAFAASAVLSAAWLAIGLPESSSGAGLAGYNAVIFSFFVGRDLTARLPQYLVALSGGSLAHLAFHSADLAAYTFPFVVSCWIYLALRTPVRGERVAQSYPRA